MENGSGRVDWRKRRAVAKFDGDCQQRQGGQAVCIVVAGGGGNSFVCVIVGRAGGRFVLSLLAAVVLPSFASSLFGLLSVVVRWSLVVVCHCWLFRARRRIR